VANPEHVKLLRQGFLVWNAWRTQNPLVCPDLTGANLTGANLSGADLNWAHLKGANLNRATLHAARLMMAHLNGANLTDAHLKGADLMDAKLNRANLNGANLTGAHLMAAQLVEAQNASSRLSLSSSQAMPRPGRFGQITEPSAISRGSWRIASAQSTYSSQWAVGVTDSN
jgi:Pentapeptide repeats (8 copies)